MTLRVLVRTPLSQFSGYGRDGMGLLRALVFYGADVYVQPAHVDPPLPPDIAHLLTKELKAPFDLMIQHVDPMAIEDLEGPKKRAARLSVAWTMWEFLSTDNMRGRSKLAKKLADYDMVLGYDQVSVKALRPHVERGKNPPMLGTLMGGYDSALWAPVERDWFGDRIGFCMVGALHTRKDPFVAIQAFQELKQEYPVQFEPAELHLKTNQPTLHPLLEQSTSKLRIHYAVWPQEVLKEFYASQHVLLAPSRGEGKNLPALEFMTTGGTVIATNWGGHASWLSEEYAYPLDYILKPERANKPNCLQARASKQHLKELMLNCVLNREEAKRKGEMASSIIPMMLDWQSVVVRLFERLKAVPEKGPYIFNRAQLCRPTPAWGRSEAR